ncbi:hypothetical protein BELL_0030g00080 [Botrytis elliptica]|uniref:Uncharacterized protein n=1 Tax=Botrytis elliptica TaxID=278938 RepID=A0A4Z1K1W9_9HELO|nr:hypothetical protein EAE99_004287 [Botrytis elliptica]TGO79504.1 hypothetical protein BELL_0030g00080 [Botrytis elliptica]
MREWTIHGMFATYNDAARRINAIKLQLMGGRPLHEPRPQLIIYLPNDVNRYWEIIEDMEEYLGRYNFNNLSNHMDFTNAMRWYFHGGKEGFELKAKDIYNPIAIHVPGTREEISRIKNDPRMTFVVLTKRKRMMEGMELWYECQNQRERLDPNPQDGNKSQLELHEERIRARDLKDLGTLYLTLLHGLKTLIHCTNVDKNPYKSAWNLKALNIRGQLQDLYEILSEELTELYELCERCGIEDQGSEESNGLKQMISGKIIKMLIHMDYLFMEISDPSMYKDTITTYIRERKSLNYVSEMKDLYAEESETYYTVWEPQLSRRMNAITNGIRVVTDVLHDGRSLLGIS